jgi:Stress responsive A/B Barrel Domain
MLAHNVYFSLKDNSNPAREKLLAACRKYLTGHLGTFFFACGTLASELRREVNDRDFDVALHITFGDQATHDQYQESARHRQFIAENKDNWKKVRVFDSIVEQST